MRLSTQVILFRGPTDCALRDIDLEMEITRALSVGLFCMSSTSYAHKVYYHSSMVNKNINFPLVVCQVSLFPYALLAWSFHLYPHSFSSLSMFFFLIDLYWSISASQYRVSFCCTAKWISHRHTHVPISPPSWASLPPSLSHPPRSSQSTKPISLCYAAASH